MKTLNGVRVKQELLIPVLALIPIGIFYWYQLYTAINIPIFDDYGVILSFLNHITDSNSFLEKLNLLFGKYAEHRLFFTRLVAWLDYNIFGEVSFIRLGFIGNLGIIWIVWILFKSFKADQYRWWFFLPIVFILFQLQPIFTIATSSAALQHFYTILFGFGALYILNQKGHKYFYLALVLAVLGTFSSGNGIFIFVAGLLPLLMRSRRQVLAIWVIAMLVSNLLYFYSYNSNLDGIAGGGSSVNPIQAVFQVSLNSPLHAAGFLFTLFGSGFSTFYPKAGFLISLLTGFGIITYILHLIRTKYYKVNPLISSFLLFIVMSGLAVAFIRSNYPVSYAYTSTKYIFYSLLIISLIYMTLLEQFRTDRPKKLVIWALAISIVLYVTQIINYGDLFKAIKEEYIFAAEDYYHPEMVNSYGNDIELAIRRFQHPTAWRLLTQPLKPNQPGTKNIIEMAAKKGVYYLPHDEPRKLIRKKLPPPSKDMRHYILINDQPKEVVVNNGWALIIGDDSYDNVIYVLFRSKSNRYVFPTTPVGRPELVRKFGSMGYMKSGFKFKVTKQNMNKGKYKVGLIITENARIRAFKFTNKKIQIL